MFNAKTLLVAAGLLAAGTSAGAQTTIDTYGNVASDRMRLLGLFDPPWQDVPGFWVDMVGQTFRAPAGETALQRFSFGLFGAYEFYNPADLLFRMYLMEWNPATYRPVGDILWESDTRSGNPTVFQGSTMIGDRALQKKEFDIGGLVLDAGREYVALVSTANVAPAPPPGTSVQNGVPLASGYAGGVAVASSRYLLPGDPIPVDFRTQYYGFQGVDEGYDLAFSAEFAPMDSTVTPEPISMALLGTGLAGVGAYARRRRRREDEDAA